MKNLIFIFLIFTLTIFNYVVAQVADESTMAKGVNFIKTNVYSSDDDERILKLLKDLRVADVSDGMDMAGLPGTGLVNPDIQASWTDPVDIKHVFRGIAVTVRYVPTQRPALPKPGEEFSAWEGNFYSTISTEAFTELIRPGTAIVIDDVEDKDIGSIGSNNILNWYRLGAVGVVTDAGARDTDEVGLERVPLYLKIPHPNGQGLRRPAIRK